MSSHIVNNLELLQAIKKMNTKQRKAFLLHADNSLVIALCEMALNCLNGNIQLTTDQKLKLSCFKWFLRALARKGKSLKAKRKYLIQGGGAGILIPLLINVALSTLASALTN